MVEYRTYRDRVNRCMAIFDSVVFIVARRPHAASGFKLFPFSLFISCVFLFSSAFAAEPISQATDCTEMEVQADINPELSKDENLQRLSELFYESLNTVTHCESASDSVSGAQSSTEGGMGNAAAGVAASDISGTESDESLSESNTDSDQNAFEGTAEYASEMDAIETDDLGMAERDTEEKGGGTKAPNDIPPADNDSIFEKQIREAAENETDPEVKERLWNEYRKYKGLPVKPVKEKS
jgi:hypothetical protein